MKSGSEVPAQCPWVQVGTPSKEVYNSCVTISKQGKLPPVRSRETHSCEMSWGVWSQNPSGPKALDGHMEEDWERGDTGVRAAAQGLF